MKEFKLEVPKACQKCSKFMSKDRAYRIDKRMFVSDNARKEAERLELFPIVQKLLSDRVSFCADCNRELRILGIVTIKVIKLEEIIRRAQARKYKEGVERLKKRFNGTSKYKSGQIRSDSNSNDKSKD